MRGPSRGRSARIPDPDAGIVPAGGQGGRTACRGNGAAPSAELGRSHKIIPELKSPSGENAPLLEVSHGFRTLPPAS